MVDLMDENVTKQECKSVPILFNARGQDKGFSYRNNGHGFMGSLNHLSLIYGDYHVIDKVHTIVMF